jgi:membrane protease YdiL (CAAX protease family)
MSSAHAVIDHPVASVPAHSAGRSILLHLAPGVAAMGVYIAATPAAARVGLPSIAALAVSGLLGVVPIQLGVLARHRRLTPDQPANRLRVRLPLSGLLGFALLEIVLGGLAFALTPELAQRLRTQAFGWWPEMWIIDTGTHPGFTRQALLTTAVLMLLGSVIAAPVVEEFYFRGYLLPRMPRRLGRATAPAHAVLFASYHLWTPWLTPTRIVALLPLAYIAGRTRDIRIGILTHIVLNAVDLGLLTSYLLRV